MVSGLQQYQIRLVFGQWCKIKGVHFDISPPLKHQSTKRSYSNRFPLRINTSGKKLIFFPCWISPGYFFWAGWVGGSVQPAQNLPSQFSENSEPNPSPSGFFSQPLLDPLHPGGGVPFALRKALDATARSGIWGRLRPPTMHTQPQRSAPSPLMHPPLWPHFNTLLLVFPKRWPRRHNAKPQRFPDNT